MKLASLLAAALLMLGLECALLRPFGLSVARFDVGVVFVLFLALRLPTLQGLFGAAAVGYFVDVLSGDPSGLAILAAVLTFGFGRLLAPFVEARGAFSFAALCLPADAFHNLAVWAFALLGTPEGVGRAAIVRAVPVAAALTALAGLLLWPALKRLQGAFEKPETGLLRSR